MPSAISIFSLYLYGLSFMKNMPYFVFPLFLRFMGDVPCGAIPLLPHSSNKESVKDSSAVKHAIIIIQVLLCIFTCVLPCIHFRVLPSAVFPMSSVLYLVSTLLQPATAHVLCMLPLIDLAAICNFRKP